MVPERGKPKARQSSLAEAHEDKPDSTDSLVAKAFDSDPKVRLRVAQELGRIDDPRSVFALIELSSDKEEAVKVAAQKSLGQFKGEEEAIVSLEKLLAERKEAKAQPASQPTAVSQMMAPTIERLFSHYEPNKRESVKKKLFPSLQKLFGFSKQDLDPLHELEKIGSSASPPAQPQDERGTSIPAENATNFPFGQKKEEPQQKSGLAEMEEEAPSSASLPDAQPEPDDGEASGEEKEHMGKLASDALYSLAYRIATTPGMGKAELKREQNRLLANFKKELGLAFKTAEERAAEDGLASLSNLKPGMKNLSFAEMQIVSISDVGFGAKKKPFEKIKLSDGHREVAVLIPHERAAGIAQSDRLALKGVSVDFLIEGNEVVLVVKNRSKVIVVK